MHFDLCIVGTGSGNTILDERFDDQRIALIDSGTFGGTCLNVGCIPTKMLAYPADLASSPAEARRLGVDLVAERVRWHDIRDRIFGRVDATSSEGRRDRLERRNVTVFEREARFVAPRVLQVGAETVSADRVVLAAGSRPTVPDLTGLQRVPYHTSDTIMRLDELPESLAILGGGYVAAEFAHIFGAFGTRVTILNRSDFLLSRHDGEIRRRFTDLMSASVDVRLRCQVAEVIPLPDDRMRLRLTGAGAEGLTGAGAEGPTGAGAEGPTGAGEEAARLDVDMLLVATGRIPNSDRLNLPAAGVETDDAGYVVVDEHQATSASGVFALGDISSHQMLKHVANADARVVQHNLLHPESPISSDHRYVPNAIFSSPQVASVGMTEEQARERGIDHITSRADYDETAYGWAMEDSGHFCKVLADPRGELLGGHLIGPQATVLIQPLVQALSFGTGARELARGQYWPHPAMSEVVEQALLKLPVD
jgi:mycothione reductase